VVQWQSSVDGGATFANIPAATAASYTPPVSDLSGTEYRAVFSGSGVSVISQSATLYLQTNIAIGSFAHRTQFTAPNGVATTVYESGPGIAMLELIGNALTESTSRTGVTTVSGTPQSFSIAATGTTAGTALSILGARGAPVSGITGISTDGGFASINARNVALTGNIDAASLARVVLGDVSLGTLTISGASFRPLSLSVGNATSYAIESAAESINLIQASSWTNSSNGPAGAGIAAPYLGRMTVTGELSGSLAASTLGTVIAGFIDSLTVSASKVTAVRSRGILSESKISAASTIGTVSAAGIIDTQIISGSPTLDSAGIPTVFDDLARIASVTAGAGGFSNSLIAADMLGSVRLSGVSSTNAAAQGVNFGVVAHQFLSLTAVIDGHRVSLPRPKSQAAITASLTKAGVPTDDDLVIWLV
jgi:hypothetical protein